MITMIHTTTILKQNLETYKHNYLGIQSIKAYQSSIHNERFRIHKTLSALHQQNIENNYTIRKLKNKTYT